MNKYSLHDFNTYFTVIVIKTVIYQHKSKEISETE